MSGCGCAFGTQYWDSKAGGGGVVCHTWVPERRWVEVACFFDNFSSFNKEMSEMHFFLGWVCVVIILYVMIHRWILEFESCYKLHLAVASRELARKQAGHALERMQLSGIIQRKVSTKSIYQKFQVCQKRTSNLFLRLFMSFFHIKFVFWGVPSSKNG